MTAEIQLTRTTEPTWEPCLPRIPNYGAHLGAPSSQNSRLRSPPGSAVFPEFPAIRSPPQLEPPQGSSMQARQGALPPPPSCKRELPKTGVVNEQALSARGVRGRAARLCTPQAKQIRLQPGRQEQTDSRQPRKAGAHAIPTAAGCPQSQRPGQVGQEDLQGNNHPGQATSIWAARKPQGWQGASGRRPRGSQGQDLQGQGSIQSQHVLTALDSHGTGPLTTSKVCDRTGWA